MTRPIREYSIKLLNLTLSIPATKDKTEDDKGVTLKKKTATFP